MSRPRNRRFSVNVKLVLEVGLEVPAQSLKEAVEKAEAWTVADIVDFSANGWDHNDSEKPAVLGVFES